MPHVRLRSRGHGARPGPTRRPTARPRVRPRSFVAWTATTTGWPDVSVPVLSNSNTSPFASCSSTAPPLTITPNRAARDKARDHGDRCRQDQWARCRHHQNRDCSNRIPGQRPSEAGDEPAEYDEHGAVAIGHANERRGGRFGLLHQTNDRGICRIAGGRCRSHLERPTGVDHAASNLVTGAAFDLPRLTGQRRLVEDRSPPSTRPSTASTSPGLTNSRSPGSIASAGTSVRSLPSIRRTVRGARPDECTEVPLGTCRSACLDRPPTRQHQRDDGSGEHLADGERTHERRKGDDVGAETSLACSGDHRSDRRDDPEQRRGKPRRIRRAVEAGPPCERPDDEAGQRRSQQDLFEVGRPHLGRLLDAHGASALRVCVRTTIRAHSLYRSRRPCRSGRGAQVWPLHSLS